MGGLGHVLDGTEFQYRLLLNLSTSSVDAAAGADLFGKAVWPVAVGFTAVDQWAQAEQEIKSGVSPSVAYPVHWLNGAATLGTGAGIAAAVTYTLAGGAEGAAEGSVAGPWGALAGFTLGALGATVVGNYLPSGKWWTQQFKQLSNEPIFK